MNLKTAARRLGVHYQTAYRWVRGGELVAVKVGAGYEISEAALDRFQAQRTALERVPDLTLSRSVAPRAACTRDSALEMLDGMIAAITLDAEPVVERAVRIAADVLGDGAVITLRSCDDEFSDVRVAHCDAVTELTLATVARHAPFTKDFATMVARTGRPVFVPQVPQRDVRSSVQAEQHEHLVNGACFSLICVPVGIGDHTEGALLLARDQPGAPYEHDDVAFAEALASRVARARLLARRYQAAWSAREHVVDVVTAAAVEHDRAEGLSRPALHELLDWACAGDPEAVVAFLDLDLCHLVCSKAYAMVFGQVPTLVTAMPLAAFVDDNGTIPFKFEKVLSGELDYRTIEVRPLAVPAPMMLHCAMIRRPDATPWCIAVVGHIVPRATCSERVTTAVR